jgi:glycosyltransferase involved in cell wall biosynthesis
MRICSLTPHELLNNPRIVREADALAAAGHDVRVVAVQNAADQTVLSESLASGRAWRLQAVDIRPAAGGRRAWFVSGVRQKIARAAWRRIGGRRLATIAYARTAVETLRLAVSEPADLVIAHTHPMLGVADEAARRLGCRWGFDCEDILSEEYGEGVSDPAHRALVQYVERTFVPRADYVTTASPEFGPWLTGRYGIAAPTYVANVPALADAPDGVRPGYPDARRHLSLYWFSISIGPERGVEDAIRALPLIDVPVQLHLRGRVLPGFDRELAALIGSLGVADRVQIHDLAPPAEVVRAASDHDIGLVLMQPCCVNHELAVPNKIYAYAMAGLAVGATTTRGLSSVVRTMGATAFQYTPGDHAELARHVNALAADPARLRASRAEAFRLAQARFNWDVEQRRLVDLVATLKHPSAGDVAWQPVRT